MFEVSSELAQVVCFFWSACWMLSLKKPEYKLKVSSGRVLASSNIYRNCIVLLRLLTWQPIGCEGMKRTGSHNEARRIDRKGRWKERGCISWSSSVVLVDNLGNI